MSASPKVRMRSRRVVVTIIVVVVLAVAGLAAYFWFSPVRKRKGPHQTNHSCMKDCLYRR